jgi:hypothetical protein
MLTQKGSLTTTQAAAAAGGGVGGAKATLAVNISLDFNGSAAAAAATEGNAAAAAAAAAAAMKVAAKAAELELKIRIPGWAAAGSSVVVHPAGGSSLPRAAAAPQQVPVTPGSFLSVAPPAGGWKAGDVITAEFVMLPRLKPINDKRPVRGKKNLLLSSSSVFFFFLLSSSFLGGEAFYSC